jgi:hypothetical protein
MSTLRPFWEIRLNQFHNSIVNHENNNIKYPVKLLVYCDTRDINPSESDDTKHNYCVLYCSQELLKDFNLSFNTREYQILIINIDNYCSNNKIHEQVNYTTKIFVNVKMELINKIRLKNYNKIISHIIEMVTQKKIQF